jgi:hypothetical protein
MVDEILIAHLVWKLVAMTLKKLGYRNLNFVKK